MHPTWSTRCWPLAATLLTLGCGASDPVSRGVRQAITGGLPVTVGHPAVAALGVLNGDQTDVGCTAVLIAPSVALSAAHCLSFDPRELRLIFGADAAAPQLVVEVREQVSHPLWVGAGNPPSGLAQANDLALLLLDGPVDAISPVALATPADGASLQVGDEVDLVGFGALAAGAPVGIKRAARARIAQLGEFELRVGFPGEAQACDGDSGGPALASFGGGPAALVGLVSRAVPSALSSCEGGAIYTRLDAYLAFIQDQVALPCGSGPVAPCDDGAAPRPLDGGVDQAGSARDSAPPVTGIGATNGSAPRPQPGGGCALAPTPGLPSPSALGLALLAWLAVVRRRSPS